MAPHTPAICSGSGSLRNLERVQAHSLLTSMGRLADGPGGFLQQRLAEPKRARRAEVPSRARSLDRLWSAAALNTCAHVRTGVDDCLFSLPNPSLMLEPLQRHYARRRRGKREASR